jgi:hypothetical protein
VGPTCIRHRESRESQNEQRDAAAMALPRVKSAVAREASVASRDGEEVRVIRLRRSPEEAAQASWKTESRESVELS